MEGRGVFWSQIEGVYLPWTLNGQSRCSLDGGWSERVFLGKPKNAEFIYSLETIWYMAAGGQVDGLEPWRK